MALVQGIELGMVIVLENIKLNKVKQVSPTPSSLSCKVLVLIGDAPRKKICRNFLVLYNHQLMFLFFGRAMLGMGKYY